MVLAKMDEFGRPAWIAAVVAGFWLFWPIGLVTLSYLAWTGRLAAMRQQRSAVTGGRWENMRKQAFAGPFGSSNQAFDDYRTQTLRRLEEEQAEFVDYLDRLRRARDKSEFDQFMAERNRRGDVVVDHSDKQAA